MPYFVQLCLPDLIHMISSNTTNEYERMNVSKYYIHNLSRGWYKSISQYKIRFLLVLF